MPHFQEIADATWEDPRLRLTPDLPAKPPLWQQFAAIIAAFLIGWGIGSVGLSLFLKASQNVQFDLVNYSERY